ncbi:hypothetical protein KIN20_001954 [Parelaphostrongylus tenuis]|uniref:Uncharacterized protein n=1 Tax=Parelaphostrongylus tenuis TaxID=148309 RepID=A0AAD5MDI1_PARTN|nr:hypothetical protein KIN20_001954 [Parelaphostrongylus tenuis]
MLHRTSLISEHTQYPSMNLLAAKEVMTKPHCIVVGSTVTALCDADPNLKKCDIGKGERTAVITTKYATISGSLTV